MVCARPVDVAVCRATKTRLARRYAGPVLTGIDSSDPSALSVPVALIDFSKGDGNFYVNLAEFSYASPLKTPDIELNYSSFNFANFFKV